ncbi:MAG: hypothetical protein IJD40_00875 [Lachnospiraceae bacterium]|nr:hypothetical protein [Lachnospiraceae bacterium]
MIDNNILNEYGEWVDEATSKSELIDILYDIRNDALDDNDDDDNNGGMTKVLRR